MSVDPDAPALDPTTLYRTPNALAPAYSRFRVSERLLLTGHSHQAWPDVSFDAQQDAWLRAAELVDDKWDEAEEQAARACDGWRRLLNDPDGDIALGQNTHELIVRLLSALPLARRPRLVTTDGEFHSIRRQLDRLAEEGLEVARVAAHPVETLADRLVAEVTDRTACVLLSSVLFETAEIVPDVAGVAEACARRGAALLVDAYHHLNVLPFDVAQMGLQQAFITGGGYKYCQLGEGNAFLRVPAGCDARPIVTGWYTEFAARDQMTSGSRVAYGAGAARFAGATYDPTAHYRAAAVFDFHARAGLVPELLREVSRHQVGVLLSALASLRVPPERVAPVEMPAERRAGFLAIRAPLAGEICRRLRELGVMADSRGSILRLGPAPYLCDDQLHEAMQRLGAVLASLPTP